MFSKGKIFLDIPELGGKLEARAHCGLSLVNEDFGLQIDEEGNLSAISLIDSKNTEDYPGFVIGFSEFGRYYPIIGVESRNGPAQNVFGVIRYNNIGDMKDFDAACYELSNGISCWADANNTGVAPAFADVVTDRDGGINMRIFHGMYFDTLGYRCYAQAFSTRVRNAPKLYINISFAYRSKQFKLVTKEVADVWYMKGAMYVQQYGEGGFKARCHGLEAGD